MGYAEQQNLNKELLSLIYVGVTALVNEPVKDMERSVRYYDDAYEMWQTLVKASSQNPTYALQNIPVEQRNMVEKLEHKLLLLRSTYYSKSGS